MNKELKPCPFCGSKAEIYVDEDFINEIGKEIKDTEKNIRLLKDENENIGSEVAE